LHQIGNKLAREEISTHAIRPAKWLARLQGKRAPKPLVHKATEKIRKFTRVSRMY